MSPIRIPDATIRTAGTREPRREHRFFMSADVATMPRELVAVSANAVASGRIAAGRAIVGRKGSFTKLRLMTGTTVPAGLTDMRYGVWDEAATTLLASTANVSAIVTAASTVYLLDLVAPVSLVLEQEVYIGGGSLGTTPPILRGIPLPASTPFAGLDPILARYVDGWAGGALPAALPSVAGSMPWAELS